MKSLLVGLGTLICSAVVCSAVTVFEATGSTAGSISGTVDAFRAAIGSGSARQEINWDGVPNNLSDPNLLPGNFFNVTSPRGAVLSTPGTGLLVSANAGLATSSLFGFPGDLQTFSSQKLFTAVNSNIVDVTFFLPGTTTVATTSAFGAIFVDVELDNSTSLQFFDEANNLLFSRYAMVGGNQGLTFLGGFMGTDELISRVRITSGFNTIVSNSVMGVLNDDFVVMDNFIYATPTVSTVASPVPDAGSAAVLLGLGLAGIAAMRRRVVAVRS